MKHYLKLALFGIKMGAGTALILTALNAAWIHLSFDREGFIYRTICETFPWSVIGEYFVLGLLVLPFNERD